MAIAKLDLFRREVAELYSPSPSGNRSRALLYGCVTSFCLTYSLDAWLTNNYTAWSLVWPVAIVCALTYWYSMEYRTRALKR